jgi:hypothetical protein
MTGVIGATGDADVIRLEGTIPGHAYRARLTTDGSALDGHLTVLDDGRGDEPAGADYVRLHRTPDGGDATVEFVALGGGVLLVVRDARDVDGGGAGGDDHTWRVQVEDVTAEVTAPALTVPGTITDALPAAGAVRLYPFAADAGADVVFDLATDGFDGRLFVVSTSVGDWIARNDDRAIDDTNPRIDAPLFEEGPYLLLVESNSEAPEGLGFTLTSARP